MPPDTAQLLNEIRYAERLCQRTARFYRHMQAGSTFLAVIGGTAIVARVGEIVPGPVAVAGLVLMGSFGALSLAMRPADKAVANEIDQKRYTALRVAAAGMTAEQLRTALDQAHAADAPEIESLRDVVFNDVVHEVGRSDAAIPLGLRQRVFSFLA